MPVVGSCEHVGDSWQVKATYASLTCDQQPLVLQDKGYPCVCTAWDAQDKCSAAEVPALTWSPGSFGEACLDAKCVGVDSQPTCGDTGPADGCGSFPKDCDMGPSDGDDSGEGGGQGRAETDSCRDSAGTDPIQLSTKAAVTEPYTDFELAGIANIKLERTYSSADTSVPKPGYRAGTAPGIFGRGWHHNWEAYLSCASAGQCTLVRGLKSQKVFQRTVGMSAVQSSGEVWDYFTRQGIEAIFDGDQDLLVHRKTSQGATIEFVIYGVDGTELHFQQYADKDTGNCVAGNAAYDLAYCPLMAGGKDVMSKGKAALTMAVSASGLTTLVSKNIKGNVLLRLQDGATASALELRSEGTNLSLARTLFVNPAYVGGKWEGDYVSYAYTRDATSPAGDDLTRVTANHDARTLRGYAYNANGMQPGHLAQILGEAPSGEARPVLVDFGYDAAFRATHVADERSDATVAYTSSASIDVWRSAGGASRLSSHARRGGRSGSVTSGNQIDTFRWAQRQVSCFSDADGRTTWLDRDQFRRVVRVRRFAGSVFNCKKWGDPTEAMTAVSDVTYGYDQERVIGSGLPTVKLDIPKSVTRTKGSLLSASADVVQTFDYNTSGSGDPSGYQCLPAGVTLPVGAAPCRIRETGFTQTVTGTTVAETRVTYFSYDQYARVTKVIGPVSTTRPYADDVTPIESRTYYPVDDAEVAGRGRLKTVTRSTNGMLADANASSLELTYVQTGVQTVDVRLWFQQAGNQTIEASATYTLVNDSRGRPITIVGPGGATKVSYFEGRRPSLVVTPGGGAYRFLPGPYGRPGEIQALTAEPGLAGSTILWREVTTPDAAGDPALVERFDANGSRRFSQAATFDADHRPMTADHPSDPTRKASWEFDPAGVLKAQVNEMGIRTELSPDAMGRPLGAAKVIRDANQNVLQQLALATYTWETPVDLVKTVTDGAGNTSTYVHDDFGRVVSVTSTAALGTTPVRMEWDVRSNLKVRKLGSTTVTMAYDGLDRVKSLTATSTAGSAPVYQAFTYDFDGQPGSMVGRLRTASAGTAAGNLRRTTTFSWDAAGRLQQEKIAVAGTTATLATVHGYDANGVETTVTYPSGFAAVSTTDEVGRVTGVQARSSTGQLRPLATLVQHEPMGPLRSMTLGNGQTMSRVSNLRYEPDILNSGPLAFDYAMGWSGNVDAVTTNNTSAASIGYDLADRLKWVTPGLDAAKASVTFSYTGQAVTQAKAMVGASLVPTQAFGYDGQRSLSAVGKYDSAGATIPTTVCLLHDALGRLTAVGPAQARLSGPGATACQAESDLVASLSTWFEYDAFNRRAARQDGTTWVEYVHSPGGQLLAEVVRPATAGGAWATRREYAWVDGQPLAQLEYPGPAGRTDGWTYWYHLDHLGTPRALTNESGTAVWAATPVRPYGDVVESTVTDPLNGRTVVTNLRLPGQYDERLLSSVGLQGPYYNWNRWYVPSMGRYLELDPIAASGGFNGPWGPNWYGYAEGNPLRWTDRTGLRIHLPADPVIRLAVEWALQSEPTAFLYRQLDESSLDVFISAGTLNNGGGPEVRLGATRPRPGREVGCGRTADRIDITVDTRTIERFGTLPFNQRPFGGDVVAHELSHAHDWLSGRYGQDFDGEEARAWWYQNYQRITSGLPPLVPRW
jgi:RHS repeat-associated protein